MCLAVLKVFSVASIYSIVLRSLEAFVACEVSVFSCAMLAVPASSRSMSFERGECT